MPRVARKTQKTTLYHIIQQSPFLLFRDNQDRMKFLSIVEASKSKYQFNCYGFSICLDQRFELIIHVKHQSISKIMQSILISYSKYVNASDPLFPNRYKSIPLYNYPDVIKALDTLNTGILDKKASLCFYSSDKDQSYKLIDFFSKDSIYITDNQTSIPVDESFKLFLTEHGCCKDDLNSNQALRNQCILKLYRESGCTIKTISNLFNVSPSLISKILKKEAN